MSKRRINIMKYKGMEYDISWDEYSKMHDFEKVGVYEYLYWFFNENALALDVPPILVYDHIKEYLLRRERYEFLAILRDFRDYYGESF